MNNPNLNDIAKYILDKDYSELLIRYLKLLVLQNTPSGEEETVNKVMRGNDLEMFMRLVKKYVPDYEAKIYSFIKENQ